MVLAAYGAGLSGTAVREVRMRAPVTTEGALRIAVTIEQGELQESRNNSFYVVSELDTSPSSRARERPPRHVNAGNTNSQIGLSSQIGRVSLTPENPFGRHSLIPA